MERKEILVADKITKIYGIGTKTLFEALHEVSLTMYEGEFVCIMGPSGAGKSTFINNLSTIDIPTKGKVFINGKEVRVMSEGEIGKFRYENLGFIFQEFNLLDSLTIFENIAYGKKDAKQEDVVRVAKAAHIHEYIMSLPNGYDTILNENGMNISQGQKQLLTIARAMLLDASMLILDEATSNVDTRTEQQIQEAMQTLMRGKTCFVIAHRLSTIKNADEILVVMGGEIVEQGTHKELLTHGGIYAELYRSQFH